MKESSEVDYKRYIQTVYKKRYIFIITAVAIMTFSVAVSYLLPKVYEAKSTVFIERNVINSLVKDIAITPSMDERLKVLSYAMKSRNILTKVVDTLGVDKKRLDKDGLEKFIAGLQDNTDIKMKDMDLFVVSYKDEDPKFASEYVNTLVRLYVEENLSSKREEAYGANSFLSEQIKFFKEKLDAVEADVIEFRKEKGIFVAVNESNVVSDIKGAQDNIEAIKISKRELEARKKTITKQLSEEKPYTVAIYGKDSLKDKLALLQKKLNELLVQYTNDYPDVIKVQSEIESVKAMMKNRDGTKEEDQSDTEVSTLNPLYQQLKEESTRIERELAALAAKGEQLVNFVESKKEYLRNIPAEKTKLAEIEMERNTYRNIYEELVAKLGQSEVSKQMEIQDKSSTFRIVDPAMVSSEPVSPNRLRIMLMGIIAGLAGGIGIVIGLDTLDTSAKTVSALRDLGYPVLAVIERIKDPEEQRKARKRDVLAYSLTGVYVLFLMAILMMEAVGFSGVERLIKAGLG